MPCRPAFALTFVFLIGTACRAEILPTLPLRELTIRADAVVLAVPINGARPGFFRVRESLKGREPRAGAEIEVAGMDAYMRLKELPELRLVDAALLFLRPAAEGRFELVESGIRLHTRERTVWHPVQPHNPGGYQMMPESGVDWDAVVLRVRVDAAETTRLQMMCELADVIHRDNSVLAWVERHRNEFTDGRELSFLRSSPAVRNLETDGLDLSDLETFGWGELQLLPFVRVLQGRVPADCWRAVNLYAEINQGALAPGASAAFASREARLFLLGIARDNRQLAGRRARALRLLGDRAVVGSAQPDERERTDMLDGLQPLLTDQDATRRGLTARALLRMVGRENAASDLAVKALSRAYRAAEPGPARNAIAEALYDMAGPERWATASGRPNGSLALLRDLGLRDDKLFFWVTLKTEPAEVVKELPTLILERLDPKGTVAETKKLPLPVSTSAGPEGWAGNPRHVELSHIDWNPGIWRLRVAGVYGVNKTPWESEPRTVRVELVGSAQARAEPPGRPGLGGFLRSIVGTSAPQQTLRTPDNKTKRTIVLDGEPL